MKAEIKRVVEPTGACWFIVESEAGKHHYGFKENQPEDSVWNEERNYKRALEMVKLIESGATKKEEVVYTSPSTPPVRDGLTKGELELRFSQVNNYFFIDRQEAGEGHTVAIFKEVYEELAEELVRRYNAFPELVEALKDLVEYLGPEWKHDQFVKNAKSILNSIKQ